MGTKAAALLTASAVAVFLFAGPVRADALAKLKPEKLEEVHRTVQALRSEWQALPRGGPYREYRANLHVHSGLSHDSRGTVEEIVAAAKASGTRVLLFTEHPADHYDFYKDGHRGIKDGVLLIPGAETKGFLAFPTRSLQGVATGSPQEFSDLVRSRGGLTFLSHLEERMDWNIQGLTGVIEIPGFGTPDKNNKYGLSGWSIWSGGTTTPDSGTTAALLGLGLTGLAGLRARFGRK